MHLVALLYMSVIPASTPFPAPQREEYIQTVTIKGQVTIPAEVRAAIGVKPNSQVTLRLQAGRVVIEPVEMTLEEAFASVKPQQSARDYKANRDAAIEEHVEKVINEMRS